MSVRGAESGNRAIFADNYGPSVSKAAYTRDVMKENVLSRTVLGGLLLLWLTLLPAQANADVWVIDVHGAIGPASADHMVRGLEQAQAAAAELVVLRIDTPGGLDSAMRDMIKSVLGSTIPVVGYVAPSGARAASAGTYLMYATHVAAMAPGTNLGAATPVQIGAPGLPGPTGGGSSDQEGSSAGDSPQPGTPMERKIVNDAVAYIQSLAQLRERNAVWAEQAVRRGSSLSAEDALEKGVIDLIAPSLRELLQRLQGREVQVGQQTQSIQLEGLAVYEYPMDWRSEFLAVITDPSIAYVLMLVGIYGLIIEFYSPGLGVPGIMGSVCLLLALYAFQVLPISYSALALILLGIALMMTEAFSPSFGVLGLGGIVAFVMGSIMLMDTELPGYQIAMPVILGFTAFSVVLLVIGLGLAVRSRQHKLVSGVEQMLGMTATVEAVDAGINWVRVEGELWEAACEESLAENDLVTVDAIDGLTLQVRKQ